MINVWERIPYIGDATNGGLVRNFTKAKFNTTDEMPSLELLRAGFTPGFDKAPPGHVGTVVSPFRRIHRNFLIANYNALSSVALDDAGSRTLMYDNYMVCEYLPPRRFRRVIRACHRGPLPFVLPSVFACAPDTALCAADGQWGVGESCHNSQVIHFLRLTVVTTIS